MDVRGRFALRSFRGALAVGGAFVVALLALAGGCADDGGGGDAAWIAGSWNGSLGLSYNGGGGSSGSLTMNLDQAEDFASGVATWSPARGGLSVAGPIDDASFTLLLHFRCANGDSSSPTTEVPAEAIVVGYATGNTLVFTGASGLACPGGGVAKGVGGASGSVSRGGNGVPLGTPSAPPPAGTPP